MTAIPLRDDFDAASLRTLARQTKPVEVRLRMLGIAAIYDGQSRKSAAEIAGVGVQILRDWVIRFNNEGPSGLYDSNRKGGGGLRLDNNHKRILISILSASGYGVRLSGAPSQNQILAQFEQISGRTLSRCSLRGYLKMMNETTGDHFFVNATA